MIMMKTAVMFVNSILLVVLYLLTLITYAPFKK